MRGGPNTGFLVVCNGCPEGGDKIYYSSRGSYGDIDYCWPCAVRRCPNLEELPKELLRDHFSDRIRSADDAEAERNVEALAKFFAEAVIP